MIMLSKKTSLTLQTLMVSATLLTASSAFGMSEGEVNQLRVKFLDLAKSQTDVDQKQFHLIGAYLSCVHSTANGFDHTQGSRYGEASKNACQEIRELWNGISKSDVKDLPACTESNLDKSKKAYYLRDLGYTEHAVEYNMNQARSGNSSSPFYHQYVELAFRDQLKAIEREVIKAGLGHILKTEPQESNRRHAALNESREMLKEAHNEYCNKYSGE